MGQRPQRGRVYRRCGCSDSNGKQLGPWCPQLAADVKHGKWTYCVDLAPDEGRRRTRRRGGFSSRAEAAREMAAVLDGELRGVYENRRTTVAGFLREWLAARKGDRAPNTYAGYADCVERDLIPAFGRHRLPDLRPQHIEDWIRAQQEAGRGRVTVYRVMATLRNALNAAVRSWRLRYNPAKYAVPPKPRAAERTCWTPDEAAAFLRHNKCDLPSATVQNILAAAGEACANAIEHGHRDTPGNTVYFRAEASVDKLRLTIADTGRWKTPQPERNAHRGRGMGLMHALMQQVTVTPGPTGTTVDMHTRIA